MGKIKYLIIFIFTIIFLQSPHAISAAENKVIKVNLTNQTLTAYEQDKLIYQFPISSGKSATPTPTGNYKPWTKLLSTRMTGGDKKLGTFYDLPNVPYVVYFYNGYGIHGTYWHNNFGYPMSHGCINVHTSNMKSLYYWIDYDTTISIFGSTPRS